MDSFKTISKEEVEGKNRMVTDKLNLEEKQGKHMDDITELGFEISPDVDGSLPIKFKHEDVNHVVPIVESYSASDIINEMPEQTISPEIEAKKKELEALKSSSQAILEGSKINDSIEKVLAKDTQSEFKARYEALKQSITQPINELNTQYKKSLADIAKAHNAVIDSQIAKTSKAAIDTRRKYKIAFNKTKSALKDRLSGKSKGILGSLKSSKLQNIEKTLGKDEAEITNELEKAKRYTSIKKRLLEWSKQSADKSELTEAQIETIVNAFPISAYEGPLNTFIETLNINTMSIISLILTVLQSELELSTKYTPQNKPILINILKQFIESLQKINNPNSSLSIADDSLEGLLAKSIETYATFKNDSSYITPMKLFDIKDSLFSILESVQPSNNDNSDNKSEFTESSSSTSSTSSRLDKKRAKIAQISKERGIASDTLTPIINRIKADVDEYVPDIKLGQLLLTTERELKNVLRKKTGELKEKHYYLDINGKVKKIGSNTEYKLVIDANGLLPPYLPHVGVSKSQIQSSPAIENDNSQKLEISAPTVGVESEKSKSSLLGSFSKGFQNRFMGRNTVKSPSPVSVGGRRRTRKIIKNKTRRNNKN